MHKHGLRGRRSFRVIGHGWVSTIEQMSAWDNTLLAQTRRQQKFRVLLICTLIALVGLSHWLTPVSHHGLHAIHVLLRKMFVLPIILAAVWFEFRGALLACMLITLVYVPHVLLQWTGNVGENINQIGELSTLWLVAMLAGALVRREKRALLEVARTHEGSLLALVAALDAREHETEIHSLRVRAFALRIGRQLRMGYRQLRVLAQAAILHDIGKIGIPDHILLKPGALEEEDWVVMHRHPEIGRRILSTVPFLAPVAEIVCSHHEKYDGTGYPRELHGDSIPFAARVYAVADVFDALTSDRPYRKSISIEEARGVILDGSGTHFDPQVVEAFLSIHPQEWTGIRLNISRPRSSEGSADDMPPVSSPGQ